MKLKGTKALVTGGLSGLGLAVTQRLLAEGGSVAIFDNASAEFEAKEQPAFLYRVDITDSAAVTDRLTEACEAMGGINLAVNCAGVVHSQRVVGRDGLHPQADFERVIDINLNGSFAICRAFAQLAQHNPPNPDGERGLLINTASIAAFDGQIGQAAYAASKGAIVSLTLPLAREFAALGIRVMCIAPGVFNTPMLSALPDSLREDLRQQVPFPERFGDPAEYADLVCHIIQNPMLNGETIRLDAALRMP